MRGCYWEKVQPQYRVYPYTMLKCCKRNRLCIAADKLYQVNS